MTQYSDSLRGLFDHIVEHIQHLGGSGYYLQKGYSHFRGTVKGVQIFSDDELLASYGNTEWGPAYDDDDDNDDVIVEVEPTGISVVVFLDNLQFKDTHAVMPTWDDVEIRHLWFSDSQITVYLIDEDLTSNPQRWGVRIGDVTFEPYQSEEK